LTAKVYSPYVLLRTLDVWGGLTSIVIPEQIRSLIEATYQEVEENPMMLTYKAQLQKEKELWVVFRKAPKLCLKARRALDTANRRVLKFYYCAPFSMIVIGMGQMSNYLTAELFFCHWYARIRARNCSAHLRQLLRNTPCMSRTTLPRK
jgi:hypothetical protein